MILDLIRKQKKKIQFLVNLTYTISKIINTTSNKCNKWAKNNINFKVIQSIWRDTNEINNHTTLCYGWVPLAPKYRIQWKIKKNQTASVNICETEEFMTRPFSRKPHSKNMKIFFWTWQNKGDADWMCSVHCVYKTHEAISYIRIDLIKIHLNKVGDDFSCDYMISAMPFAPFFYALCCCA